MVDSLGYATSSEIQESGEIFGLQGNKVYVIVALNDNVSITEDTTIYVDIDGEPKWKMDSEANM